MHTRHTIVDTTLGPITIVASDGAITGLYFRHHIRRPSQETFGEEVRVEQDALLADAATQLDEYLTGARREFELPLEAAGDVFQQAVWSIVAEIPFGANPMCIVIPCHRVLGANGKLTGYAGGLKRKQALLELEEPVHVRAGRLF